MTLLETLKPHFHEDAPWKKGVWKALEARGLPTKKWDAFRYASLKHLNEGDYHPLKAGSVKTSSTEGMIVLPLKEAMRSYGALLQKGFQKTVQEETNPYALLNAAFADEGLFLYIPPGKTAEMEWEFPSLEAGKLLSPKIEVFVGKGAHFSGTYALKGEGKSFYNGHLQLTLDEGATAALDATLEHSSEGFAMHTLRARLKKGATLKGFTFSKGAKMERHDIHVTLEGEESCADLKGLAIPGGREEIHHYITMLHKAPRCRSNQHYKTALMGHARASFEGKIFVEQEAQETEAYQLNKNLLLSPHTQAMSKPNLEILADDVKASHGATCSRPKEEELFYLRTRGLSKKEAERHLARGFCYELIRAEIVDHYLSRESE